VKFVREEPGKGYDRMQKSKLLSFCIFQKSKLLIKSNDILFMVHR